MSQPVNDLRVTRSQRFIREALIDLIEERSFDALSVGEITARAMVSRATFYRHYRDKYDLAHHHDIHNLVHILPLVPNLAD